MSQADRDLVKLLSSARAGSPEAVGETLEACRAYLLAIAGQELDPALKVKGGASDLVQQTFLEAQRDFHRFDGATKRELLAWLRQVLLNNVANFARAYRETEKRNIGREVELDAGRSSADWRGALIGASLTPSRHATEDEQTAALEEAMQRLPEDYRQVIEYRYREERSFEQIGQLMDRSADATRKLWSRAVERLKQELTKK